MPGYYIEDYDAQDFSSFELDTDPSKKVEGRYWKISYWLKDCAKKVGPVQLARNYVDLMTQRGGKKLYDASGGTAVAQMPAAVMLVPVEFFTPIAVRVGVRQYLGHEIGRAAQRDRSRPSRP